MARPVVLELPVYRNAATGLSMTMEEGVEAAAGKMGRFAAARPVLSAAMDPDSGCRGVPLRVVGSLAWVPTHLARERPAIPAATGTGMSFRMDTAATSRC
jgi:hypothetical protein